MTQRRRSIGDPLASTLRHCQPSYQTLAQDALSRCHCPDRAGSSRSGVCALVTTPAHSHDMSRVGCRHVVHVEPRSQLWKRRLQGMSGELVRTIKF